jgi:hypothetical protein
MFELQFVSVVRAKTLNGWAVILLDWRVSGVDLVGVDLAGLDWYVSRVWTGLD